MRSRRIASVIVKPFDLARDLLALGLVLIFVGLLKLTRVNEDL